jgi:hypothetical protein
MMMLSWLMHACIALCKYIYFLCACAGSGHDAELARQAAHLQSILEGVGEECKVNRELAGLLLERLDSSRK